MRERVTSAKHLQNVCGAHNFTYWTANFVWDFAIFMIPCVVIIITFAAFNEPGLSTIDQYGRFFVLFVLFAWATLPLTYIFSFWFTSASSGFTKTALINLFFGETN